MKQLFKKLARKIELHFAFKKAGVPKKVAMRRLALATEAFVEYCDFFQINAITVDGKEHYYKGAATLDKLPATALIPLIEGAECRKAVEKLVRNGRGTPNWAMEFFLPHFQQRQWFYQWLTGFKDTIAKPKKEMQR